MTVQSGWTEGLLPGARLLPGAELSLPFCTMWLGSPPTHTPPSWLLPVGPALRPQTHGPSLPRLSALSTPEQWMGAAPRLALHRTCCFLRPLGKFFMLATPEKTQWKGHKRCKMFLVPSKQLLETCTLLKNRRPLLGHLPCPPGVSSPTPCLIT